jgi:hypothetical protein
MLPTIGLLIYTPLIREENHQLKGQYFCLNFPLASSHKPMELCCT